MPEISKTSLSKPSNEEEAVILNELDALFLESLEKIEDYVRSGIDEERLMKEGYIHVAHSRMCMKPYQLTLDGFTEALDDISASSTVVTEGSGEDSHRVISRDESKDGKIRTTFGKFIPSSIKLAQNSFHKVIERQVERSNIASRLRQIQDRITVLRSKLRDVRTPDAEFEKIMEELSVN